MHNFDIKSFEWSKMDRKSWEVPPAVLLGEYFGTANGIFLFFYFFLLHKTSLHHSFLLYAISSNLKFISFSHTKYKYQGYYNRTP